MTEEKEKRVALRVLIGDKQKDVTYDELCLSNNLAQEALVRLLVKKKVFKSEELLKEIEQALLTDDEHLLEVLTRALSPQVEDLAERIINHPPARGADPHAPLEILVAHENARIEGADLIDDGSADQQTGPGDPPHFANPGVVPAA